MTASEGRRRAAAGPGRRRGDSSPASHAGPADEIADEDGTRLGFLLLGAALAVPIILFLVAVAVPWWLAAVTVVPATLTAAYLGVPRRVIRVGPDFLSLREGRKPEVRLALSEIEEVERVWVLHAGYHLELRTEAATIEIRGLGTSSEPFLRELGVRLLRTASPQLRWGPAERQLLGITDRP